MDTRNQAAPGLSLLPLEEAILSTIASGCTDAEAAERLGIGLGAVRAHLGRLARKLGAHSRAEAFARFMTSAGSRFAI
jgi:LuxR family transcriptional regulator, regulator of acetate metabolism